MDQVSHADSVLLTQGEPPDANLQGVCVGRLTHAYASEGAGVSLRMRSMSSWV